MDVIHRKIIKEKIGKLVQHTEFRELLQACRNTNLLSDKMVCNLRIDSQNMVDIEGSQTSDEFMHKKLFEKITHRGPEAFERLKQILKALDKVEALQILQRAEVFYGIREERNSIPQTTHRVLEAPIESVSASNTDAPDSGHSMVGENSTPALTEFLDNVNPKEKYEVVKANRISTCDRIGTYKMQSNDNRGVLFIANYINFKDGYRNGAINDSDALIYVFRQLGFKIFQTIDGSQTEFFDLLETLLNSEYTRQTESFVLAFMSHGKLNDQNEEIVAFSDNKDVKVKEIVDRFSNRGCPNLIKKPKVLIFPFCRGSMQDKGITSKTETDTIPFTLRNEELNAEMSDLLICYATIEGFKAHRDTVTGSWYIQELCKTIAEHAHDTHFEDMLKIVHRKILEIRVEDGGIQMGNYRNIGFNFKFFLNPAISEE